MSKRTNSVTTKHGVTISVMADHGHIDGLLTDASDMLDFEVHLRQGTPEEVAGTERLGATDPTAVSEYDPVESGELHGHPARRCHRRDAPRPLVARRG